MTSNDNQNYITADVFNAHMARIEALLERNLALTRADMAELKSEIKADINNLRTELKSEINGLRTELKSETSELRSDIKSMNTRIEDLVHWNYWIIAFIVALFMLPSVIEGVKSFFGALTKGIISVFKRKEKTN